MKIFKIDLKFLKKEDDHSAIMRANFGSCTENQTDLCLVVEILVSSAMLTVAKWKKIKLNKDINLWLSSNEENEIKGKRINKYTIK